MIKTNLQLHQICLRECNSCAKNFVIITDNNEFDGNVNKLMAKNDDIEEDFVNVAHD